MRLVMAAALIASVEPSNGFSRLQRLVLGTAREPARDGSLSARRGRALICRRERLSELSRSVDVGAVLDGQDGDQVALVVDAGDHAVAAPPGAVQPGEPELEWLADPPGIGGQGAVQELHRSGH